MSFFSFADVAHLVAQARREPAFIHKVCRRLLSSRNKRVTDTYAAALTLPEDKRWWDIPAVKQRWNQLISGSPHISHRDLFARYIDGNNLSALSLGCGTGHRELAWARTGRFKKIIGLDLSPKSIQAANQAAADLGLNNTVLFQVANVMECQLPKVDLVIAEMALHHLAPMETICHRIREALLPGGGVVIDEYVGPNRFQWPAQQLKAINACLDLFPRHFRTPAGARLPKARVRRQGTLAMRLSDPSEAPQSQSILPTLRARFTTILERPYRGNLIPMVFNGIASHFMSPSAAAHRLLDIVFTAEDTLIEFGELKSDYAAALYRK